MFEKKAQQTISYSETSSSHTQTIETVVGAGAVFEGTISTQTALRVDGTITGDIKSTGTVIVGADGTVNGTVAAADLLIAGTVEGNVTASGRTEFVPGGYLHGDLTTGDLVIQQGAALDGKCKTNNGTANRGPARQLKGEGAKAVAQKTSASEAGK